MLLRRRFLKNWLVFLFVLTFFVIACVLLQQSAGRSQGHGSFKLVTSTVASSLISAAVASGKQVTKSLSELGPVPELSAHVLFFNRVPKSGSEMIVLLIQWLQGLNSFRHVRLTGGDKRKLTRFEQDELVNEVGHIVRKLAVPITFDRHVYFVNFTSFDKQSPTYVNLIRDPVDKVISRFYYSRITPNPNNPDLAFAPRRSTEIGKKLQTLEECVVAGDPECHFVTGQSYDLTIPYFCGQNPKCMVLNNHWALAEAKSNVERYYAVVGVLEELNSTLELFEHKLPYFFKGVQKLYFKELLQPHFNKNKEKPKQIDEDVKKYLRDSLELEYEFYEWIKSRLFQELQIIYGNNH